MVRKNTRFGGKLYPLPIIADSNANATANFANAQANTTAMVIKEFMLQRVSGYQVAQIGHEAMLAAATDEMSFINGVKAEVDQAIQSCVNFLAASAFRNGTGSIGQISTIGVIGTGVIQLVDPNAIVQFQVGQVLQDSATDGGAGVAALGYVIAMDRSQGRLTVSAVGQGGVAGQPAGWLATHYLTVQGNINSTLSGLGAWLNAPNVQSNDNFFGVNRFTDVTRLAGVYYDGSAQSIEEALIDGSSLCARESGKPDVGIVGYSSYSALEKSLGAKVTYTQLTTEVKGERASAEIAFRGIMINGANSQIRIFPDRNGPGFRCNLLEMKDWCLYSLGEAPQIFNYGDDVQMLRMAAADSAELRIGFYGQIGNQAPGHSAWIVLGQ